MKLTKILRKRIEKVLEEGIENHGLIHCIFGSNTSNVTCMTICDKLFPKNIVDDAKDCPSVNYGNAYIKGRLRRALRESD